MILIFQELLTRHKIIGAEFLEANYSKVFDNYQKLLNSENYVTRRQALKVGQPCFHYTPISLHFKGTVNLVVLVNLIQK